MALIGDTVLFRLDEDIVRPLIVVSTYGDDVTGVLFLDWEGDRVTQWCRDHCFYSGAGQNGTMMVYRVPRGSAVGTWNTLKREKK